MKTVAWVLVLLVLIMWVFAIFLAIIMENQMDVFDFSDAAWPATEYWGTVGRSMMSLFQILTLDKWSSSIVWPLLRKYPLWAFIFLAFLAISVLALLNTIVGVVVESTLSSARANEEREGKELQKIHSRVMDSLRSIFDEADTDESGSLDRGELHASMRKASVRDRMRMMEIPIKDLDLLFTLLDEEETGLITIDRFFRGCTRLRGPAMACDLHHMHIDLDRNIKQTNAIIDHSSRVNDLCAKLLDNIDTLDIDIVKGPADLKDPVVMARRARHRHSRSELFRASWVGGRPPVLDRDGHQVVQVPSLQAGSPDQRSRMSSKASVMRAQLTGGDPAKEVKHSSLVRCAIQAQSHAADVRKPSLVRSALGLGPRGAGTAEEAAPDQPAPPPMPKHLQPKRVESKTEALAKRAASKTARSTGSKSKSFQWCQ